MKIVYRNLERSKIIDTVIKDRMIPLFEKFPAMKFSRIVCTIDMDNSPEQGGRDVYRIKVKFKTGQYQGVVLEKEGIQLYVALAELVESLHERLRRFDEKRRTIKRSQRRTHKESTATLDPSLVELPRISFR